MKGSKPRLDSSAGMFKKAEVSYRVEAGKINQLPPRYGRTEGQLVSYQPPTAGRLPAGTVADVQIAFPHPEKREGYAQVIVRVEEPRGPSAEEIKWWKKAANWSPWKGKPAVLETWVLDIPQNELSGIINDLHNSGYFTSYDKTAAGAELVTQLDGAKVSKSWRHVPQLDELVVRVRTHGRLLSNPKGPASSLFKGLAGPAPSSVRAYRELNDEEGSVVVSDANGPPLPSAPAFQIVRLPAVNGMVRR